MAESDQTTRRDWLAKVLMGAGLILSYGTLAAQGVLFVLPKQLKARTRKLFAGKVDQYEVGNVQTFHDLQGNEILVKRGESRLEAFSSTCPHLGCRVEWIPEKQEFFCPCHRGGFDANGKAIYGPPADGNQNLYQVPLTVDEASGVVYIEVKDVQGGKS